MTYTFAKAHDGEIGDSIVELDKLDVALGVEELAKKNGVELVLGSDCTATNGLDFGTMTVKEGAEIINCPSNKVPAGFEGVDAGPESQKAFANAIAGDSSATTSLLVAVLSVRLSPRQQPRVHSHSSVVVTL